MLRKKKAEQKLLGPVDIQTVIELLREQIAHARQLLNSRPIKSRDLEGWNSRTRVSLIRIYGEGSPNVDTIVGASGAAPVWIFMPDDVKEKYEASRLENKARLLEGCVMALKREEGESEGG